ncbi:MAG: hypothetical protein ACTS22_05685 [Phycisphaerales bacterium]
MSDPKPGSLMEGIEFERRRPVDADWSKRKRVLVGSLASVLAMAAIGVGGYYGWQLRPVSLPATPEEAIQVINSGRVDRLSPERQQQYFAEAARLLRDTPREQWREMFDENDREAIGRVFQEQFEESIREIARGNSSPQDMMRNMWGGGRPGGDRPARPRGEGDNGSEEGPSQAERRQRFASRLQQSFQNGDAQRNGLMGEFFMMMRAQRDAAGGNGQRPNRGG